MSGRWCCALLTCGLLIVAAASAGDDLPPASAVKPELYATGFAFAEGPALDEAGNLFVVNYRIKGTIGRITPDGSASIWCDLTELSPVEGRRPQANGLKIDSQGRLIVADAGGGRLLRVSADGREVEVLAERFDGVTFRSINDVALDVHGNIYFTDPGGSTLENPIGSVYRYDIRTKRTRLLASGFAFPNGLAVAPDDKHFCLAESQKHRVLLFDIDTAAGKIENQRVLIEFPSQGEKEYIPDGMVFDAAGRLYVATWTGATIHVVNLADGTLLRQYDAGGSKATNCHFHNGYLYTTVAAKEAVFRLRLGVAGHRYFAVDSFPLTP